MQLSQLHQPPPQPQQLHHYQHQPLQNLQPSPICQLVWNGTGGHVQPPPDHAVGGSFSSSSSLSSSSSSSSSLSSFSPPGMNPVPSFPHLLPRHPSSIVAQPHPIQYHHHLFHPQQQPQLRPIVQQPFLPPPAPTRFRYFN
ncbi:basic-leucine zipper transcription factor A-like [Armigeres subalbatus]|uniref:basic-leucine zipper transcription factor A-like n=1 Tax=Armigeres subalbatus TaxID=124917 RepID=UPI002ED59AFB